MQNLPEVLDNRTMLREALVISALLHRHEVQVFLATDHFLQFLREEHFYHSTSHNPIEALLKGTELGFHMLV